MELFNQGQRPEDIAQECGLVSKMSFYSWAQRYCDEGQWGLMNEKGSRRTLTPPNRSSARKVTV
nr:hypothetical protein [Corynebacterium lactis]